MANVLDPEETRVGFLFDGDESSPLLPAQLKKTEGRILVTLPWYEQDHRELERWFSVDAIWGDDLDKTRYRYQPPETFDFHDAYGWVALVGCRSAGSRQQMASGVGQGNISVRFALPGARNADTYFRINGLRSEVDGLGRWMRLRSLEDRPTFDDEGRLQTVDLHLESPPPIKAARPLNLTVRPSYRYGPGDHPDETTVVERMLIETDVRDARAWDDHLALHFASRDLLRIAAWRPLNFLKHEASRDDDPYRTLDGQGRGRMWTSVETFATKVSPPSLTSGRMHYLFYFEDIGALGFGRWIALRTKMQRAVDPIVRLLELEGATLETHFSQLCIGLEALGYQLARDAGVGKSRAGDEPFRRRVERIVADCGLPLPFDSDTWVSAATAMYRAVKHADNELPDATPLYFAYFKGIQLFRVWLASRLGVTSDRLVNNEVLDPVQRSIEREAR